MRAQSNHCRATAAAARRFGLEPHLILRTDDPGRDPGLVGNLLVDRMVGARLHLIGRDAYNARGMDALVNECREELEGSGRRPYAIPAGGSDRIGTCVRHAVDARHEPYTPTHLKPYGPP